MGITYISKDRYELDKLVSALEQFQKNYDIVTENPISIEHLTENKNPEKIYIRPSKDIDTINILGSKIENPEGRFIRSSQRSVTIEIGNIEYTVFYGPKI
ncbi:MAG: hypothetical protein KAH93_02875 [Candidatus Aenigmarchaeota archaeon]|nr:hypothetical protein [Candidatus Aenigmarchaeota archaeon]